MFYRLNGTPEIDAALMSSDARKKEGEECVYAKCVCWEVCVHVHVCLQRPVCTIQIGSSEGFTHANEAT